MSQTLTYLSTLVSLVSGAMTILGVSGLLTWSLTDKKRGTFDDNVIGVMAATTKLAIAVVVLLVGAGIGFITHFFVLLLAKGSITASDNIYWDDAFAGAHIAGYAAAVILWLPLVVLCVSSVFSWSLSPFVRFYRALSNKQ